MQIFRRKPVNGQSLLLLALAPFTVFAELPPADPGPRVTNSGAEAANSNSFSPVGIVGAINIHNGNVFDVEDPKEDKFLFRLANRLHATTRPDVVRQQLVFRPDEPFVKRQLEESERILRKNRYLQDAKIEAVEKANGVVDVNVRTTDSWTLIPKLSLSRSGGENKSGVGLKEMNLFGSGVLIEALYKSDVDRDSTILKFVDRHIGDSWYGVSATYANNSDGHNYAFALGQPFYSLESTSAQGISLLDFDQVDSLYEQGEIVSQYRHQANTYRISRGWSGGLINGWARRFSAGLAYDEHRFASLGDPASPAAIVPTNRKFAYPFISYEVVQDKFEVTENQDLINRTEDRFLGTRFGASLGIARESFGSDRDTWLVNAGAQTGFGKSDSSSLILAGSFATRIEDSGAENLTLNVNARFYHRQSDKSLFYASLNGTFGHNLDIDNPLYLGGDNGLRGYPLRYQAGDRRASITLEQRVFTDWYPFRLFHIGGAVFFDAGRTWDDGPQPGTGNELLSDIGFGLRIGNQRSGEGRMTHIDFAFPLDGDSSIKDFQFLIETKKSF